MLSLAQLSPSLFFQIFPGRVIVEREQNGDLCQRKGILIPLTIHTYIMIVISDINYTLWEGGWGLGCAQSIMYKTYTTAARCSSVGILTMFLKGGGGLIFLHGPNAHWGVQSFWTLFCWQAYIILSTVKTVYRQTPSISIIWSVWRSVLENVG